MSFIIDLSLNVSMAALFFRMKRHCGAIAERRLDCKSLIIFLFFKIPMEPNNDGLCRKDQHSEISLTMISTFQSLIFFTRI